MIDLIEVALELLLEFLKYNKKILIILSLIIILVFIIYGIITAFN
jgi:hypothetical protein